MTQKNNQRILLTGGAGFIGSSLLQNLLSDSQKIIVLDNFDDFYDYKIKLSNLYESIAPNTFYTLSGDKQIDIATALQDLNNDQVEIVCGDICNQELLQNLFEKHHFGCVVHLAALAGVRPSIQEPARYYQVNVQGTLNLLECCKLFGVKNFLCASSSSVYGNNSKTPFAETDSVDFPISPYASTKKSVEVLSHVYHALYGINQIHLRFFTVFGPRQRPDLAIHKFTRAMLSNDPIDKYGDGSSGRDYTYIDDILQGIEAAMNYIKQKSQCFEIINLGENQVITLNQMIESLEKTLQIKANIVQKPMQPGDVNLTFADISKAKKLLSYQPQWSFDDGIASFVQWYKKYQDKL